MIPLSEDGVVIVFCIIVNRVSIEFLTSSHLPADLTLDIGARLSGV